MTTPVRPRPVAAGPAPAAPEPTEAVTPRPRRRGDRSAGLLIVPGLVWYGLFMAVPLVVMFALSLFSWNSIVGTPSYTGFSNYRLFADDDLVAIAARNSLIYVVGGLILIVPPGFLLGCWLHRKPRGHAVLSIVFFTPWIVSASARAMMFTGLYQPNGVINSVLSGIGLGSLQRLWLANSTTALPAAIVTEAWTGIGVSGVIFAAALSRIPGEVFEAARLDGANRWQEITRFALPLTRDFVALWTMLQFLWLFLGSAANILLLTKGGPGSATLTLSYYMYDQAFVSGRIGYSQAIGVLLFFVGVAGMLLIKVTLGRTEKQS